MKTPTTLSEIREQAVSAPGHVFHSSLPLYILLEKRPKPDNPDWVVIHCLKKNGAEGMVVYLSPLDATIDLHGQHRNGARYQVFPFEAIDSRPYIQAHDNWFTVYLAYGFAAHNKRLMLSERGKVLPLVQGIHFHITSDVMDHFHLRFGDGVATWIDNLHAKAQMQDYAHIAQQQADSACADINQQACEALTRIEQPIADSNNIDTTHCTLYDPIEQQWRFVDFSDLKV